jgi:hypothetical protein
VPSHPSTGIPLNYEEEHQGNSESDLKPEITHPTTTRKLGEILTETKGKRKQIGKKN